MIMILICSARRLVRSSRRAVRELRYNAPSEKMARSHSRPRQATPECRLIGPFRAGVASMQSNVTQCPVCACAENRIAIDSASEPACSNHCAARGKGSGTLLRRAKAPHSATLRGRAATRPDGGRLARELRAVDRARPCRSPGGVRANDGVAVSLCRAGSPALLPFTRATRIVAGQGVLPTSASATTCGHDGRALLHGVHLGGAECD